MQALEEHGYLVGGLTSLGKQFRIPLPPYVTTLRLFSNLLQEPAKHWPLLVLEAPLPEARLLDAVRYLEEHEVSRTLSAVLGRSLGKLAYHPTRGDRFALSDAGTQKMVSGEELAMHVNTHLEFKEGEVGSGKPVNRTTNDAFQDFTRAKLPRNLVVQDIDALHLEHRLILETKRSNVHKVLDWTPYPADGPNYQALLDLAQRADVRFRTACFKPTEAGPYSLFDIVGASRSHVTYRRIDTSDLEDVHKQHPPARWSEPATSGAMPS